jgi:hypothetical protein
MNRMLTVASLQEPELVPAEIPVELSLQAYETSLMGQLESTSSLDTVKPGSAATATELSAGPAS